jgi:isopentenyl-diphosphate delta-isomerase
MNRKDHHLQFAYAQQPKANAFDTMQLTHQAFPETALSEIDLSVKLFNQTFPFPFYINAMTGGSAQAKTINQRLAMLAKHFGMPMATGSLTAAIKDPSVLPTFQVVRETYPEGFLFANIGVGQTLERAKKVIDIIKANALQIHVNPVQEAVMPEGDKDFRGWLTFIQQVKQTITVPLVVKEVGFGMSELSLQQLVNIGVQYVDVAGQGGTNFAVIENQRRTKPYTSFDDWGISTVQSLLNAKKFPTLTTIASGGIRSPLDVVKSLVLGAKMVGLSGFFLHLVKDHTHEEAVAEMQHWIEELKLIMLVLGKKTVTSLSTVPYTWTPDPQ